MGGAEGFAGCGEDLCSPRTPRQEALPEAQKPDDFPVLAKSSPDAGRFLVTKREVSAGELLLQDLPVALGPRAACHLVCLGCHELIQGEDVPRCPGCWWPLCSRECSAASRHAAECAVLAADTLHAGQPQFSGYSSRYDVILVVRCLLLRQSDPAAWRGILDLASHVPRRLLEEDEDHEATVRYVTEVLQLEKDVQVVNHVRDAIATNCFEWKSPSGVSLRGVYLGLSRLNHACRPSVSVSSDSTGAMFVRAVCGMGEGEALTISYTATIHPLWERRCYTRQVHYFTCDCVRCSDPTELGLHFSSPRCEECKEQFLEPTTWLEEATWECPLCGARQQEAMIREEVDRWMGRFDCDDTFIRSTPSAVTGILRGIEMAFHQQHHVWLMAAQVAIRTLEPDYSLAALALKRDLWLKVLTIYDVLEPGLTRRRGVTLFQLGEIEVALAQAEREAETLTEHFYRIDLRQALRHLQEAAEILGLEPPGSHELQWLWQIQRVAAWVVRELGDAPPLSLTLPNTVKAMEKSTQEEVNTVPDDSTSHS